MTQARGPLLALALGALACSSKPADPPPPVSSGTLPPAPPHATGALAAGRESAFAQQVPAEAEDDSEPALPVLPAPSDDKGSEL
jgi:hypothetical protein